MSYDHTCSHQHWLACIRTIYQHPGLAPAAKFLWMWLYANQNATESQQGCLYSYKQLSEAVNMPCEIIHRILFTLKIMGCLRGALPVTYQKLDEALTHEERKLLPCVPSFTFINQQQAFNQLMQGERFNRDRSFYHPRSEHERINP
ncbi:MAG TPA: hypothetical protein PLD88_15745 [Candidatus Berkiella sp.]|nr:hypothetical protein [Candidatus Berkiella sp.]